MEKQIIIIKPKSLSSKDKAKLTKAGNVVIECEKAHEIDYHPISNEKIVFDNCNVCSERIYMTEDKLNSLKKYHCNFYCNNGHVQSFVKPNK